MELGFPSAQAARCSLQRARDAAQTRAVLDGATGSDPALGSLGTEGSGSFSNEQPGIALVRGTLLLAGRRLCATAAWVYGWDEHCWGVCPLSSGRELSSWLKRIINTNVIP